MNTATSTLPTVTQTTFASEVIEASRTRTIVVDFSAEWCGPCRVMGPVLAELARDRAVDTKIVSVDADTEQTLLARYDIRALPTLLFFRDGEVVDRLVGLTSVQSIRARIAANAVR